MKTQSDKVSANTTRTYFSNRSQAADSDFSETLSDLYDSYVNMLFNFGCKISADRELVKDCIHDVFVKIYCKQEEMDNVLNIKSYLFVSLKNKICDELRKTNHYTANELEEFHLASDCNTEDEYIHGEKEALTSQALLGLMNQLSERERQAITLYYLESKKYEEISVQMGINYQSLRNLIYRGLSRLRSIAVEKSLQLQ